jgi:hypothetical protein
VVRASHFTISVVGLGVGLEVNIGNWLEDQFASSHSIVGQNASIATALVRPSPTS